MHYVLETGDEIVHCLPSLPIGGTDSSSAGHFHITEQDVSLQLLQKEVNRLGDARQSRLQVLTFSSGRTPLFRLHNGLLIRSDQMQRCNCIDLHGKDIVTQITDCLSCSAESKKVRYTCQSNEGRRSFFSMITCE